MPKKTSFLAVYCIACVGLSLLLKEVCLAQSAGPKSAGPQAAVQVEPKLNIAAISPGESFLVGYLFKIEKPWHIYWLNPGAAGLPTRANLKAPEGFKVGELQFPIPEEFRQPGNIVGYGYHDSLLLWQRVEAPESLQPGNELKLNAELRWLACSDLCVPGKASLEIPLPIAAATSPANAELFKTWLSKLPDESTDLVVAQRKKGAFKKGYREQEFEFDLEWPREMTVVGFFPYQIKGLMLEEARVKHASMLTNLKFKASLSEEDASALNLPVVITYRDSAGELRGAKLNLQLAP